jgi:tRNA pseudouridine55 synthase
MPRYGLLNLNKPAGITSRQAVDRVQRYVRRVKVGHAGTLDPLARGVLIVCVGAATRLIEYIQRMPKSYTGRFLLGRHSPTEDLEGDVTLLDSPPVPSRDEVEAAAGSLVGRIEQRPPAYSALKVAGRRAYALARRGESVQLQPRAVTVHRLEVMGYDYPELTLQIDCGGGTYIRSLGRDLGRLLGTAAVMSALVRTSVGSFKIDQAVDPADLTHGNWMQHLLPPLRAVESLARIELSGEEIARIRDGLTISRTDLRAEVPEYAAVDTAGELVAVLVSRGSNLLGPRRNLPRRVETS